MNRREFIRAGAAMLTSGTSVIAAPRRPNIVMILCDDLGYGDLGCYGSSIRTPNIDRMAAEGVRFTDFYAANPVCSPSRAALLTGQYPTRVGVPRVLDPNDSGGLDLKVPTMANRFRNAGYRTFMVGKWHLGKDAPYLPHRRGFEHWFGIPYSNDMHPRKLMRDDETLEQEATLENLTQRYTAEGAGFIRRSKTEPFFLYVAHTFPHIPLAASPRFRGKSPLGLYGDTVEEIDWSVGEILNALKAEGLDRDTLVMFSSDNGPWYEGSPGRLRGRKGFTLEGGMREPFIARMPGRIPASRVSHQVGSMMDILPTSLKLCGVPQPRAPIDGIDLWPVLSGQRESINREALLYFAEHGDLQCARLGNFKLHVARHNAPYYAPIPAIGLLNIALAKPELYDLSLDADESYDVADKYPDVVKDIRARIDRLMATMPDYIRQRWRDTLARKSGETRSGAWPSLSQ
jgi:arylsulfatase